MITPDARKKSRASAPNSRVGALIKKASNFHSFVTFGYFVRFLIYSTLLFIFI